MYFEFGRTLQAGLDCAGDVSPDQGAVFGWVRHRAGEVLDLRVEGAPGRPLETMLLDLHPRRDVDAAEGMAVTGFSLLHDVPRDAAGRLLVIGVSDAGVPGPGEEVAVDLFAYDLPVDLREVTLNREWGATFQLLHASALDPARVRSLSAETGEAGIFGGWLDRLPRVVGAADWFIDFRRIVAVLLPDGDLAVSAGFAGADPVAGVVQVSAVALVRGADGAVAVLPLEEESGAPLAGGFAFCGRVAVPPGALVDAVVQLRRGAQSWWFRAEAAPGGLPEFLDALAVPGGELSFADLTALQDWIGRILVIRGEALRGRLAGRELAPRPAWPRATALLFDVNDEYAARVLLLMAPQIEARFGRVLLCGAAAGGAAAALRRRGRLEVTVQGDAGEALREAAWGEGTVSPIDTASLVDAAIEGNPERLTANSLPAERLPAILALHDMAGTGTVEGTIRRVVALMAGVDPAALPVPAPRSDAIGGLVAEHLSGLWEMVPVTGMAR